MNRELIRNVATEYITPELETTIDVSGPQLLGYPCTYQDNTWCCGKHGDTWHCAETWK